RDRRRRRSSLAAPAGQHGGEPPLAAVIVARRGPGRDRQRLRRLLQRHAHREDEVEDLALPPREPLDRGPQREPFDGDRLALAHLRRRLVPALPEEERAESGAAPLLGRGAADDAEEERPKARPPLE